MLLGVWVGRWCEWTMRPPRLVSYACLYTTDTEIFETPKGSPTKFFGIVRQTISDRKFCNSFLSTKLFATEIYETPKGSPTKFFDTVRQKIFEKIVIYPFYA